MLTPEDMVEIRKIIREEMSQLPRSAPIGSLSESLRRCFECGKIGGHASMEVCMGRPLSQPACRGCGAIGPHQCLGPIYKYHCNE